METVVALAIWWVLLLVVYVSTVYDERYESSSQGDISEEPKHKNKRTIWSWYTFIFILLALGVPFFLLPALFRARECGHYATIENNLKQWGIVFKMYANESPGERYPSLTQYDKLWVPDLKALYPEYLTDISIVCDPSTGRYGHEIYDSQGYPNIDKAIQLMAQDYVYPGWLVHKDTDMQLITQYRTEKELKASGNQKKFPPDYWIREGVERFLITDINNPKAGAQAQSISPVMIARPRPEEPKRGSRFDRRWFNFKKNYLGWEPGIVLPVLFFDGHVEKIPLDEVPDHIKAMVELFPEPIEDNQDNKNEH